MDNRFSYLENNATNKDTCNIMLWQQPSAKAGTNSSSADMHHNRTCYANIPHNNTKSSVLANNAG